jgi:hypothetical protein
MSVCLDVKVKFQEQLAVWMGSGAIYALAGSIEPKGAGGLLHQRSKIKKNESIAAIVNNR